MAFAITGGVAGQPYGVVAHHDGLHEALLGFFEVEFAHEDVSGHFFGVVGAEATEDDFGAGVGHDCAVDGLSGLEELAEVLVGQDEVEAELSPLVEDAPDVGVDEAGAFVDVEVKGPAAFGSATGLEEEVVDDEGTKQAGIVFGDVPARGKVDEEDVALIHEAAEVEDVFLLAEDAADALGGEEFHEAIGGGAELFGEVAGAHVLEALPLEAHHGINDVAGEAPSKNGGFGGDEVEGFEEGKALLGQGVEGDAQAPLEQRCGVGVFPAPDLGAGLDHGIDEKGDVLLGHVAEVERVETECPGVGGGVEEVDGFAPEEVLGFAPAHQVVEEVAGGVDEAEALVVQDVLADHVFEEFGLAGAGCADDLHVG